MLKTNYWLLCSLLASSLYACAPQFDRDLVALFDSVFPAKGAGNRNQTLRRWYGGETFCIAASDEGGPFVPTAIDVIDTLNTGLGTNFKVLVVDGLADCPALTTTFYVLLSSNPGTNGGLEMLEEITGFRPPVSVVDFQSNLGLSISLPGPRSRELIFVDVPRAKPNAKPILIEEMMHSLLGAQDTTAYRIFSILAEDHSVQIYEHWFTKNPRGLCTADIILLTLLVSPEYAKLRQRHAVRKYLETEISALKEAAALVRPQIMSIVDPRC